MPFVLAPATEEDSEAVVRLQFEACAEDPGFAVIFPRGGTLESITTLAQQNRDAVQNDPTCHIMKVTDRETGELASFAAWYFVPEKSQEEVDAEMLNDHIDLPSDANKEAGAVLVRNGHRKRHEVMGGRAYACM